MTDQRPLRAIAHARAGDKDDTCNIAVIAYTDEAYALLLTELTAERVRSHFAHRRVTSVVRYRLDQLHALNFVLHGVLEGGVNSSLGLDGHGKALSFHLLAMELEVPKQIADGCGRAREEAWPAIL